MFQSSRVARPQAASKAPDLVSLLSSSEAADMETWLGRAGLYVDPVLEHSQLHNVGFIRDLVTAGSVGFVETAVEHAGLLFVAKKAKA